MRRRRKQGGSQPAPEHNRLRSRKSLVAWKNLASENPDNQVEQRGPHHCSGPIVPRAPRAVNTQNVAPCPPPEPALSEAEGFAPVPCISRLVIPVLRTLTWASSYSDETAIDLLAPSGPQFPHFTFRETSFRAHPLSP